MDRSPDSDAGPTGDEPPLVPGRRGPHPTIALGGFAALIGAAMAVVLGLLAVAFLLDRAF